jgi:hypothetical protein
MNKPANGGSGRTRPGEIMPDDLIYEERLSSWRTEAVFVALSVLFLALLTWRLIVSGFGAIAALYLFLSILFVFYALNYRILAICISTEGLQLKFGLFGWTIPWSAVAEAHLDKSSLWRIGGAGIHFSMIGGRYRAMLNFLEHPRIVIKLKKKRGPIRDVAFSTERPNEILYIVKQVFAGQHTD